LLTTCPGSEGWRWAPTHELRGRVGIAAWIACPPTISSEGGVPRSQSGRFRRPHAVCWLVMLPGSARAHDAGRSGIAPTNLPWRSPSPGGDPLHRRAVRHRLLFGRRGGRASSRSPVPGSGATYFVVMQMVQTVAMLSLPHSPTTSRTAGPCCPGSGVRGRGTGHPDRRPGRTRLPPSSCSGSAWRRLLLGLILIIDAHPPGGVVRLGAMTSLWRSRSAASRHWCWACSTTSPWLDRRLRRASGRRHRAARECACAPSGTMDLRGRKWTSALLSDSCG